MERAQDWYAMEAPGQVDRFADELAAAIERIRARPLLFAALHQEVRRSHLNVFPHEVWYRGVSEQMHQLGLQIPNQLGGGSWVILA